MGAHFKLTAAHRSAIEEQVETLIALLDAMDGDVDREAEEDVCSAHDDGCGLVMVNGERRWGSERDEEYLAPVYAADQSPGPINYPEASRIHRAMEMAMARTARGVWGG